MQALLDDTLLATDLLKADPLLARRGAPVNVATDDDLEEIDDDDLDDLDDDDLEEDDLEDDEDDELFDDEEEVDDEDDAY